MCLLRSSCVILVRPSWAGPAPFSVELGPKLGLINNCDGLGLSGIKIEVQPGPNIFYLTLS